MTSVANLPETARSSTMNNAAGMPTISYPWPAKLQAASSPHGILKDSTPIWRLEIDVSQHDDKPDRKRNRKYVSKRPGNVFAKIWPEGKNWQKRSLPRRLNILAKLWHESLCIAAIDMALQCRQRTRTE